MLQAVADLKQAQQKTQELSLSQAGVNDSLRTESQQRHDTLQARCAELHADVVLHKSQTQEARVALEATTEAARAEQGRLHEQLRASAEELAEVSEKLRAATQARHSLNPGAVPLFPYLMFLARVVEGPVALSSD